MTDEDFKGGIHAAAAALVTVLAAYNALRIVETGSLRNIVNTAIYVPLAVYEFYNAWHHWSQK